MVTWMAFELNGPMAERISNEKIAEPAHRQIIFENIRKKDDLYVDKTRYIHQLVDSGEYYFLSRPRRFGKSLTISTLKCLFQGKKALFNGLWILQNSDWEWKKYPVILIDFNGITHDSPDNLKISIQRSLGKTAEQFGLVSDAPFIKDQLKELILSLRNKAAAQVVVLIDELQRPCCPPCRLPTTGSKSARYCLKAISRLRRRRPGSPLPDAAARVPLPDALPPQGRSARGRRVACV
jgi:hypothetical protein